MKRRIIITTVLIATALAGLLFVHLWRASDGAKLTVTSNGPLDIRLWGIRPDAADAIYDPNGRKIRETLGIALPADQYWGDELQRFDFIFELPDDKPLRFMGSPRIQIAGKDRHVGGSLSRILFDYDGRALLWLRATMPRTFERPVLPGLWNLETKLDAVDITVKYYYGSMNSPGFVLQGPFEPNSTVSSPDEVFKLSFQECVDNRGDRNVSITLRGPENWNEREPIIVYDASSNRHSVITREIMPNSQRGGIEFAVRDMLLAQISAVAFAQSPRYVTFKNVNLNVAGRKRRAYPAYYDEIAERLQSPVTGEGLTQYDFRSAGEALKVIDVVRGKGILRAAEAMLYPESRDPLDLRKLSNEQNVRLRQTLHRWASAMDPQIRAFGVEIGLLCKWPEFIDPALELLERPVRLGYESTRGAQSMAVAALERHVDELSDEQIHRIADLLSGRSRHEITSALRELVERLKIEKQIETFQKPAD